jgi:hypothetical protein
MKNYWKASDIKISTDRSGFMTAEHKFAGLLIDGRFYEEISECKKDAELILKVKKERQIN